ncbi:NGG1p interacting factor NIF3 [Marinomonas sp. 15G1-11]|uniref:NGG1p interacting factor NIF3 n=1 Tax=Marinomonas phaeophyticola TaxID=3004091 RepID=A0ABT4JUQ3_9GAMM|nr:NGG1p interacting factor NIF3 [Marinomonas sp. 15G1-11]MCZ2722123.1 NGG1p interacting factor NIF3 [Marinomonas sp. 15G1-11]
MYSLVFNVPVTHVETVKNAIFAVGGGAMDGYENCCWQVLGEGQFMPGAASNPFLGKRGELYKVEEYRVEMAISKELKDVCVKALKESHPYEVAPYFLVEIIL